MACSIQALIKWAKGVYSPLRTSGLAHQLYLQNATWAIPINFEVIELNELNANATNPTNHMHLLAKGKRRMIKI